MRVPKFARILALVAPIVALGACKGDITQDGSGDPFALELSASQTSTTVNAAFVINGTVVDRYRTPLASASTVTSADPAVVRVDSVVFVQDLQQTRAYLKALATSAAGVKITFTNGALTDSARIVVN